MKACVARRFSVRIKWNYLAYAMATIVFMWVAVQTQQDANCMREFNETLRVRSKISEDNDHWSYVQRTALGDWLKDIVAPPSEIAYLRANDPANPKVTQWALGITTKYSTMIQRAQSEQDDVLKERAAHPLPQPTCGR